jgi:hypothetical protein
VKRKKNENEEVTNKKLLILLRILFSDNRALLIFVLRKFVSVSVPLYKHNIVYKYCNITQILRQNELSLSFIYFCLTAAVTFLNVNTHSHTNLLRYIIFVHGSRADWDPVNSSFEIIAGTLCFARLKEKLRGT